MNSIIQNQFNAFGVGVQAYKNALSNVSRASLSPVTRERFNKYQFFWDAYKNNLYSKENGYEWYLKKNNLYLKTKLVYSFVENSVSFYADRVYPQIPIEGDEFQKQAINQLFQWSNFNSVSRQFVTYGAATGDSFLVVSDDVQSGRVSIQVRRPWHVKTFDCDERGNIIYSVEEYPISNKTESYLYKREMTPDIIKIYKDDELVNQYENDYGFVPLVVVHHNDEGNPAFRSWRMLDEVNSLSSRLTDYLLDQADSPMLFMGMGSITPFIPENQNPQGRTAKILVTDADGHKEDLTGNLDLGAAELRLNNLLSEIHRSNPEISTFQLMRENGNLSGVAVSRLLGDIEGRLSGAQQRYDAGLIISLRQALAIAGMRQSEGLEGWANKTQQQLNLSPFDLDSYHKGDLNFSIGARPLISLDANDRLNILKAEKEIDKINSESEQN